METRTDNVRTGDNVHEKGALGLSGQRPPPPRPFPSHPNTRCLDFPQYQNGEGTPRARKDGRTVQEDHVFHLIHIIVSPFMIRSISNHYLLSR